MLKQMSLLHSSDILKSWCTGKQRYKKTRANYYKDIVQQPCTKKIQNYRYSSCTYWDLRDSWMRKWPTGMSVGFKEFLIFFFFVLQWLTFYWACFWFKKSWESIIETGNFYHGVATCSGRKFCSEIFTQLFLAFLCSSGSIGSITLIWVSLETSFPSAEVEHRWCQPWSKVVMSEVEKRPRLVTASYDRQMSQWVNNLHEHDVCVKVPIS